MKSTKKDRAARGGPNKSSPYRSQLRTASDSLHPDQHILNIEGPFMSSIAAPGATGSPAAGGISANSVSKRTSSHIDRDSAVYKEERGLMSI